MALITTEEVIQATLPDKSFDRALITDETISRAERKYIRPALGVDMYDLVVADPTTDPHKALMPYLKRALAWFVLYEAYPDIESHTSSMGFSQNAIPGTNPMSSAKYALLRDAKFQTAEFERSEMKKFLRHEDQEGLYPDYSPCSDQNHVGAKPILY